MSEIETAFIILSKDYELIFNIIDKLITNKGYKTYENGTLIIYDTYFDTKDEILKKNKLHYVLEISINKFLKLL